MSEVSLSGWRVCLWVLLLPASAAFLWLLVGGARAQSVAAPTIDHVAPGDMGLTVAWTAPAGASGVVAYDVRHILTSATDKSDANWTVVDEAWTEGSLRVIVTGLTNGVSYDVQVRATTAGVDGAWSNTTTGTPTEPGDTHATAVRFVAELPVRGVLGPNDDVDYFRFDVSGTATREYYVFTTGDTDTYGELYNQSGDRLKWSNDASLVSGPYNFMMTGRLSPGAYYVRVEAGRTGEQGPYTLHLGILAETTGLADATPVGLGEVARGVFSRAGGAGVTGDVDYFKLVLSQAADVAVRGGGMVSDTTGAILDSSGAEIVTGDDGWLWPYTRQFAMRTRLAAGTWYIRIEPWVNPVVRTFGFPAPTGFYNLYVDAAPEPGGTTTTAARLRLGDTGGGKIDPAGDVDLFRIDLASSARVRISAASRDVDIDFELADHNGMTLANHVYDVTVVNRSSVTVAYYNVLIDTLAAGTYYVRVSAEEATATGSYLVLFSGDRGYDRLLRHCPQAPAGIDDPLFGCQWHLGNDGGLGGVAGEDVNLGAAWTTTMGAGVNVAVVDDRLDPFHEDLRDNVLASRNHSYGPVGPVDAHGTAVAGLIAARDNQLGVRGVAPRASIYGYDLVSDFNLANAADAMARGRVTTSVSNNSWGLSSGPYVGRSSRLLDLAIESGLREGDGGKGVVYVMSAGNDHGQSGWASLGEMETHHGFTTVCAVDAFGERASYSEQGPNLWVCAPSGVRASKIRPDMATTYNYNRYSDDFSGTSAAAPVVSGVVALVRSANRALTWRDVKLILAETARKNDASDRGWQRAGRRRGGGGSTQFYEYSHQYGFGVVDAEAAVQLAAGWTNLPPMRTAAVTSTGGTVSVPDNGTRVSRSVEIDTPIDFVEHVELDASFQARAFRDLEVELVSPSGSVSALSKPAADQLCPQSGVGQCALVSPFRFGSSRHLGEDPSGTWTLRMRDLRSGGPVSRLNGWTLTVYGHRSGPGAPPLGGVAPGDGSLTVSWTAPSDAGSSALTGYDVRHIRNDATDKSDARWTVAADAATAGTHSYTITTLTNGIRRDVQVRAKNSARAGEWSVTAAGTPGASNGVPFFTDGESATRTVEENTDPGVDIGSAVGARDPDGDMLSYTLDSSGAAWFDIVASTGQLQTKAALDHETRGSYSVTVSVRDQKDDDNVADTAVDDTVTVTVAVGDVNEPPVVSGPVRSNVAEGSRSLVGDYSAVDPEGSSVFWSLSGDDAALFVITNRSGLLFLDFVTPPDFESPADADGDNVYDVTVEAFDGAGTGMLDVEVTVTNVNETPVLTGPSTVEVDEGTATTVAVTTFTVTDPDNDPITWLLWGEDRDDFSVSDGVLSFRAVPDFESPADRNRDNVYWVTVRVSDGSVTVSRQARVRVRNTDEAGSVTLSLLHPQVGTRIGASLSDPDGGVTSVAWQWQSSSNQQNWTAIAGATGRNYTPVAADEGRWLRARAGYRDRQGSGKTAAAASASPTRAAPQVNRPPTFGQGSVQRSVEENTPAGQSIGAAVTASDPDNDLLTYALDRSGRAFFDIDPNTGELLTKAPLNHETRGSHNVRVTARDPSGAAASVTVNIEVVDVDEDGTLTLPTRQLSEGQTLSATLREPDTGVRGHLHRHARRGQDTGSRNAQQGTGAIHRRRGWSHRRRRRRRGWSHRRRRRRRWRRWWRRRWWGWSG